MINIKKFSVSLVVLGLLLVSTSSAFASHFSYRYYWSRSFFTPKPTTSPTASPASVSTSQGKVVSLYITFYGWPDNDPPGTVIAYPVIHKGAGGIGTYSDPITFATHDTKTYPKGTIVYVPLFKKYFIMEDYMATNSMNHIDLWMNSNSNFSSQVLACENYWTQDSAQVIVSPVSNLEVDTVPLFNSSTGVCRK